MACSAYSTGPPPPTDQDMGGKAPIYLFSTWCKYEDLGSLLCFIGINSHPAFLTPKLRFFLSSNNLKWTYMLILWFSYGMCAMSCSDTCTYASRIHVSHEPGWGRHCGKDGFQKRALTEVGRRPGEWITYAYIWRRKCILQPLPLKGVRDMLVPWRVLDSGQQHIPSQRYVWRLFYSSKGVIS